MVKVPAMIQLVAEVAGHGEDVAVQKKQDLQPNDLMMMRWKRRN